MSTLSPALTAALVRAAAKGLPRGRRDRLAWVTRPTSDVAHVYVGPLTPSGRFAAATGRTVCRARTRRLRVIYGTGSSLDFRGRRVCLRCSARLLPGSRRAEQPRTRDAAVQAYGHLTLADLGFAAEQCRTVEETHQVGYVTAITHGQQPVRQPAEGTTERALFDLHSRILFRRRQLVAAARSPEEIEDARRRAEDRADDDARIQAARREQVAIERAVDRRNRGGYLTPHERQLVAS